MADKPLGLKVEILGLKEADALIAKLEGSAHAVGTTTVRIGTNVVYAWGIEFGRQRGGRLGRAAGGAMMLTNALARVAPTITPTLVPAMEQGEDATNKAMLGLGLKVEAFAKAATPVRTGNLRRSIHTVQGPR